MLRGLFASVSAEVRGALDEAAWWGDPGMSSWSGMRVSGLSSLQLSAVYGSANLIVNGISTLPSDVKRDGPDGAVTVTKPRWLVSPTADLDLTAWTTQVLLSLLFPGNAFVWVRRSAPMVIESVLPLDPACVQVSREAGRKVLRVNGVIPAGAEILHIPAMMWPGADIGLSPIDNARQVVGLGLSALEFGSNFFDGDGNMPGVIESDKVMQPDQKRQLAAQWRKMRSRTGKGLPGVLDDAATWKATGVTNEQAQFLATQQWNAAQIAGQIFLIDPSELGISVAGTSLTYANLAQRGTRLVRTTYLPWLTRIENAITSLLPRPQYFKFNVDALLRGDIKTQFETWAIGIQNGFMVPNEPRAFMDWSPLPGGDVVRDAVPAAPPAPTGDANAA